MSKTITTTTASIFEMDKAFEDERFCRVRLRLMHSGINRNNSNFEKEVIEDASETFKNIPILADVQVNEDGEMDYTAHTMHLEDDKFHEGEKKMIYDERMVGIIPETNDFEIKLNEDTGNYEVYATGLLYRAYGNYVCDILEARGGETKVSMEIICNDTDYDADKDCLDVHEMVAQGVTLLGADVEEGMKGAKAQTFSKQDIASQVVSFMQEVKESLDKYINLAKGGNTMFEELLEKYGKTVEDIDFEYEGLSDEELEQAFASRFGEEAEDTTEDPEDTTEVPEDDTEVVVEEDTTEEPEDTTEDDTEESEDDTEEPVVEEKVEFSISLDQKLYALYALVSSTYEDECFDVTVYDDYLIMYEWGGENGFKQSYEQNGDTFSLVGERVPVKCQWLTNEEITALEEMKANYSSITEELEKYKSEPEKQEVLNSDDYSSVSETDEYKELMEKHFDLSVSEIKEKADGILLDYAKKNAQAYKVGVRRLPNLKAGKQKRYGDLFNK